MLGVAHKSASMDIVGDLTQLLQDMLHMSTTDTDANTNVSANPTELWELFVL
jgi:hypothetical protein